jgi:hypothetical protein
LGAKSKWEQVTADVRLEISASTSHFVPRLTANDFLLSELSDILRVAASNPSMIERMLLVCDLDQMSRTAYCHSAITELKKHNEDPMFIRFFTMLSDPAFASAARDILTKMRLE